MASNRVLRVGPTSVTTTTATIYNPPVTSGGTPSDASGTYAVIRHIHFVNKGVSSVNVGLFLDTVANGNNTDKQLIWGASVTAPATPASTYSAGGVTVAANSFLDWYGLLRIGTADFLTAVASVAGSATAGVDVNLEGEIGVAG